MALASLIVKIGADLSDLNKALNDTDKKLQKFGGKMQDVGKGLSAAVTLPLVALGAAATKMAADAAESADKMTAVFGPATQDMNEWLGELRKTVPATTRELQDMSSGIQDLLVPLGMAPDAAKGMTQEVVKLAADLASFNNIPMEEALERIRSGLVGQNEPLLKFGVAIDAAMVKTKALEMGLIREGEALDANARAQAAFALIQERTTAAHGNAADTADSAANSMKFLMSSVKELAVSFGNVLLPVVTPMVQNLTSLFQWIESLSPTTQKLVVVVAGFAAALGPLVLALGTVLKLLPVIKVGIAALTGPIGLVVAAVAGLTFVWVKWGDDIRRIVKDTITAVRTWMVDKFNAIVESVRGKIDAVKGFFSDMYMAVVGGSYVPDMIDGIASEIARLDQIMVQPALAAAGQVNGAFAGIHGPNLTMQTNRSGGGAASSGGAGGGIMEAVRAQFLPAISLVSGALLVLKPVFDGFREAIGPALTALAEPLREVGAVVGQIITPVLEMLAEPLRLLGNLVIALLQPLKGTIALFITYITPGLKILSVALKGLTFVVSYVMEAFGWLIRAIGKAVNWLLPGNPANSLVKAGQEMMDAARDARNGLDNASGGVEDLGNAAAAATAQILNYARVVHINSLRHRIAGTGGNAGAGVGGGTGTGAGRATPPRRRGPEGSVNNFYISNPDPRAVAHEVVRILEGPARRGGASRATVSVGAA